jgi:hypothetical protein
MIKNLLPALLLDSSGPCISEMDDHLKTALLLVIVKIIDPAIYRIEAVMGNDGLILFLR